MKSLIMTPRSRAWLIGEILIASLLGFLPVVWSGNTSELSVRHGLLVAGLLVLPLELARQSNGALWLRNMLVTLNDLRAARSTVWSVEEAASFRSSVLEQLDAIRREQLPRAGTTDPALFSSLTAEIERLREGLSAFRGTVYQVASQQRDEEQSRTSHFEELLRQAHRDSRDLEAKLSAVGEQLTRSLEGVAAKLDNAQAFLSQELSDRLVDAEETVQTSTEPARRRELRLDIRQALIDDYLTLRAQSPRVSAETAGNDIEQMLRADGVEARFYDREQAGRWLQVLRRSPRALAAEATAVELVGHPLAALGRPLFVRDYEEAQLLARRVREVIEQELSSTPFRERFLSRQSLEEIRRPSISTIIFMHGELPSLSWLLNERSGRVSTQALTLEILADEIFSTEAPSISQVMRREYRRLLSLLLLRYLLP